MKASWTIINLCCNEIDSKEGQPHSKGTSQSPEYSFAPSDVRKYPYVRPEWGTSIVKACLCHNQTKRMATTAPRKGRCVFIRRNTTRVSQVDETPSMSHHPTRPKGKGPLQYGTPITMVT